MIHSILISIIIPAYSANEKYIQQCITYHSPDKIYHKTIIKY